MDVISKAEFDSQRGSEEKDAEGDGELVFGPLDQEETPPPPTTTKSEQAQQRLPEQEVEAGHRGRGQEREGRGKSPSKGSASPYSRQRRKDKSERRARFYPVLNKHDSPSEVSGCGVQYYMYMVSTCMCPGPFIF